jgi:hypothetical protein
MVPTLYAGSVAMTDEYDDYLNPDESDFETEDFPEDDGRSPFGEGIIELNGEEKKPAKKAKSSPTKRAKPAAKSKKKEIEEDEVDAEPLEDEIEEDAEEEQEDIAPTLPTDYVVHLYKFGKFSRTIDRPFTAEDAEAFASDYNRSAKGYGHFAVAGKEKTRPAKTVPWREGLSTQD